MRRGAGAARAIAVVRGRGAVLASATAAAFALAAGVAAGPILVLVPAAPAQATAPDAARAAAAQRDPPEPAAALELRDDWQRAVRLPRAPRRIVSLAPHATELLFAAGAGAQVVAADPYSVRPAAAAALPRVAAWPRPDPERLLALRPDLVVLWGASSTRDQVARLEALGLPVFVSEPTGLDDIGRALDRFASIADDPAAGRASARRYRERVRALRDRFASRPVLPVFVQAWSRPLVTLSDRDTIGDALRACGGRNVFGDAPVAAPQVSPEAVLGAKPRLIVSIDESSGRAPWERLGVLAPRGPIAFARVDASIQRPSVSIVEQVAALCDAIESAR